MTKAELLTWWELLQQVKNGWHVETFDKQELIRLNHLVMEEAHKIHNDNISI